MQMLLSLAFMILFLERAPKRLSANYTAKWGVQIAGMILGARSNEILSDIPSAPA